MRDNTGNSSTIEGLELQIRPARLEGVQVITPPTIFEDFRGHYVETYNQALYRSAGIDMEFKQDDISVSRRNVLRGIHGDRKTYKLVSCLWGSFYLVVVNNNPESAQYRQWESFTISSANRLQVLVPPFFGNGHLALSSHSLFHYKQTSYYDRASQFTLRWNDPELQIWWPIREPITSQRDEGAS